MTNILYTIIIGKDHIDCITYMENHMSDIEGAPIFVYAPSMLQALDFTDPTLKIIRTPEHWNRGDVDEFEETILTYKAKNYEGKIHFICISDFIIPCMAYDLHLVSHTSSEWPEQVPIHMKFSGSITTIHGRKYNIYCCDVVVKKFCGDNIGIIISDPFMYTGGFA